MTARILTLATALAGLAAAPALAQESEITGADRGRIAATLGQEGCPVSGSDLDIEKRDRGFVAHDVRCADGGTYDISFDENYDVTEKREG